METPASRLHDYLTTIRANLGFDKLTQMRAESKTGGALGQVSEMENKLLQAVNGALEAKNPTVLKKNLEKIRDLYPRYRQHLKETYKTKYGVDFGPARRRKTDAPPGIEQSIWDHMPEEKRKLFR